MEDSGVSNRTGQSAPWLRLAMMLGVAAFFMVFAAAGKAAETPAEPSEGPPAAADTAPPAGPSAPPPAVPAAIREADGRIQYVGPDTYILLDAEGRPQPVPGMTYEDFMAAWKQSHQTGGASSRPSFILERVDIEGQAKEGRAELRFTATVQLATDEPTVVPLGLVGAILHGEPQFLSGEADVTQQQPSDPRRDGSGERRQEYIFFNQQHGGFVAHLQGRTGERRRVVLGLIVPLTQAGPGASVALSCPRALSSSFSLTLDRPVTDVGTNTGVIVAQERMEQGGTHIKVAGVVGPLQLSWQAGDAEAAGIGSVLSAEGSINVVIDGRSVRSDARLTVRSYGGSFDRFRVRLPPGAQLVRDDPPASDTQPPAYRVRPDDEVAAEAGNGQRAAGSRVVLVELQEKQQGPVTVALSTEQPIGLEDAGSVVELGGFEVVGAVRQFGDIALEVANDWQARWQIGDHVRQVDPSELDTSLQHAGLTAAFQYDRQPWSLTVGIAARQFRVHVTPRYELECGADEARLTVHLTYQVFGSRAFEFRVRLAGWEVRDEPIDSGGLVDQERVHVTQEGTDRVLVLPLAQSSSRRAEISFSARRQLARDAKGVELPLPVPRGDAIGTGELIVRGAPDIELRPDLMNSVGLIAMPLNDSVDGLTDGAAGQRFRTSVPESVFVAEKLSRTREISVEAAAHVDVDQTEVRIDQQFNYSVRFEAIKELVFDIPPEATLDENFQAALLSMPAAEDSNQPNREMPLNFIVNEGAAAADGQRRSIRVALPQARMGQFAVALRYNLARPLGASEGGAWRLPLAQPVDGRLSSSRAIVRSPQTVAVALDLKADGSSWKPATPSSETAAAGLSQQFVTDRAETALPLVIRAIDASLPSATIVERVWLQTWFAADVRQDRVAFRLRTTAAQGTVELPPQARASEVEVLLDGAPADILSRDAGRVVFRIPQAGSDGEPAVNPDAAVHKLELRYRQPTRRRLLTRYRLTPPQVVGRTELSHVYWQIVLPADHHLIQSPERMMPASEWQWLGSFWGQRPLMSQAELEQWSGASAHQAPSDAHNVYLFSGLAPISTIEIITGPRWLIVLAASAVVLALVLPWIYLPVVRRTWAAVALACIIGGLAITFPGPALLLAQASVLGVLLAAVAVLVARFTAQPATVPILLSAGSTQRQSAPRGDSLRAPSEGWSPAVSSAASTAPTASLYVPESER